MYNRKRLLKTTVICITAGLLYYVFIKLTGLSIPCPIYKITSGRFKCPGCGITTMFLNIFKGNFKTAFTANPCVFILLPIWAVIIAVKIIFIPKSSEKTDKFYNTLTYFFIAALLLFSTVRNMQMSI